MEIIEETETDGVRARRFDLVVGNETVPGMHWLPATASGPHATVCIGHGGFQHKMYGNVPELAIQLVANLGIGVVALDAPRHGDRLTPEQAEQARQARQAMADGTRRTLDPKVREGMAKRTQMHVDEWRALVDVLQKDERWADGPFGWWGVSMGTSHGIPVVAQDGRFTAAVFGLNALAPDNTTFAEQAASITIPILFLNQSDDELMTRDAALALWDAFGSTEKTMHINPGGHVQVPRFERDSSELFFRRHLVDRG
jgi:dienelactone hydrolase